MRRQSPTPFLFVLFVVLLLALFEPADAGGFAQFRTSNERVQFQAQQTLLDLGPIRARAGGVLEYEYDTGGELELYATTNYYESDGTDYGLEVQFHLLEENGELATDVEFSTLIGVTW